MKKIFSSFLVAAFLFGIVSTVSAASLTTVEDYLNSMVQSQTSGVTHELQFTPATNVSGGAGTNVVTMEFPNPDDTLWCRTAGALVTSTAGLRNSATALPGTLSASCSQTNDTITITGVDNLTAGTLYGVIISDTGAGALGTPTTSSNGRITVTTNDGTSDVDSGRLAVDIIADDTVVVTGNVPPRLTFSISDNAVGFGDIDFTALRYATSDELGAAAEPGAGEASQLTATTNAPNGVVIEVRDLNAAAGSGLYSAASATTLASVASTDVTAGVEEYGVYGKNASSLTIAEGFDHDTTSDVAISTSYQTFATSAVAVNGGTVDVSLVTSVTGTTPAGDYEDTLIFLATGRF